MSEDTPLLIYQNEQLINARLAEQVMGWTRKAKDRLNFPCEKFLQDYWWFNEKNEQVRRSVAWEPWGHLPDAFELVEALRADGWTILVMNEIPCASDKAVSWKVCLYSKSLHQSLCITEPVLSEAICLAAKRTVDFLCVTSAMRGGYAGSQQD